MEQQYSFFDSALFSKSRGEYKIFDWDKAAELIKNCNEYPNLYVEAGLEGDWDYTGGVIYNKEPITDSYTYLASNRCTPTLRIFDTMDNELSEVECYTTDENTRFNADSKWDEISLSILNIIK